MNADMKQSMSECTCGAKPDTAHATNCEAFIHWVTLERDRLREETAKQTATIAQLEAEVAALKYDNDRLFGAVESLSADNSALLEQTHE